ncbi:MAG: hypothetical protein HQM07_06020 [Zetaproteobacteria bacterium]|nr:hypothetical protein [Zetaproteobacteria bacterium]
MKSITAFFLFVFSLTGCTYDAGDKVLADQLVYLCHQSISNNDMETLMKLYDPSFFKDQPKAVWAAYWADIYKRLGHLQEIRPGFSQKDARFRGDYYIYGYTLVFERGIARETITVFKGIEQDEVAIAGHSVRLD